MRILFIHEVNYVEKVIFEMHEFPELLALRGHDVTFFHYPEGPTRLPRSLRSTETRMQGRVHPSAEIELVTPPTLGGGVLERYVAPLLNIPSLRSTIRRGHFDVIVLYAVPTTGWQAISIAKRFGVPVVFRALDVSHQIRTSVLSPVIKAAEKYIYRNASLLSGNTPAMVEYCVNLSQRSGPVAVNLPPVDLSHFEKPVAADLRSDLGLVPDDRVVLYMGSFFAFSGLDLVVEAMAEDLKKSDNLKLVLVGGGEIDDHLRARVQELGVSGQVIFTGVVPYSRLPEYLKLATVAINPFRSELLTNVALPHKVLQYMASGVPAVSTSLRGLRGVLGDDSGVSWADSPEDVARVATDLATGDPGILTDLATRQKERVNERFSESDAVDAFEKTLESVR